MLESTPGRFWEIVILSLSSGIIVPEGFSRVVANFTDAGRNFELKKIQSGRAASSRSLV